MISYDYAMIATGTSSKFKMPYSEICSTFISDKNKYNDVKVHLTTNDVMRDAKNLILYNLDDKYAAYHQDAIDIESKNGRYFNYNLKFLAIKNAFENSNSEYIIYIDSDFLFDDNYSEEKIQQFLTTVKEYDYDLTPSMMSHGHRDAYEHKYKIFNFDKRENIPTFEENFLVFKNTYKIKNFLEKWENLYWILQKENIFQYHEGLEIGIAARYADMKVPKDGNIVLDHFVPLRRIFWTMDSETEKAFRFH